MPRAFYCSKCGVELEHTRKAVPGKGTILDLISPHNCEGYAIKDSDTGKPTVLELLDKLKDIDHLEPKTDNKPYIPEPGDKRENIKGVPTGILNALKISSEGA